MWKELIISCNKKNYEVLETFLLNNGALSITFKDAKDDEILEPNSQNEMVLWDNIILIALFEDNLETNKVFYNLKSSFSHLNINISYREFCDKNWIIEYLKYFHPMKFGKKLWIYPSGYKPILKKNEVAILLDPGLAFGTGSHQTTSLCLNYLDKNISKNDIVMDYGCGSGILSLASLVLGAKKVISVDNDYQAILATEQNFLKNNINKDKFITILNSNKDYNENVKSLKIRPNVIISNILYSILVTLKNHLSSFLNKGDKIILSGILKSQINGIKNSYSNFIFEEEYYKDDWVLLVGIKK